MSKKQKNNRPSRKQVQAMLKDGSLIEQYENMVFQLAHRVKHEHPLEDFEELVSVGWLYTLQHLPRYDNKKGALSTFIYKKAWGSMKNFACRDKTHRDVPTDFSDPIFDQPAKDSWLTALLKELGEDAKLLVTAALEAPGELGAIVKVKAPQASQRALQRYMKQTFGWDDQQLGHAWREVTGCL